MIVKRGERDVTVKKKRKSRSERDAAKSAIRSGKLNATSAKPELRQCQKVTPRNLEEREWNP